MSTTHRPAPDPEVDALSTIIGILESLEDARRRNVLLYVNARYGGHATTQHRSGGPMIGSPAGDGTLPGSESTDLGDLFDRADPQNQADRVLVVAYWKQVVEGAESFEAFPVSKELKHLGHGIANITGALDTLINQSPKLVLQIAKSGKSRQARKRYKVTREGIRRVLTMVNKTQERGDGIAS